MLLALLTRLGQIAARLAELERQMAGVWAALRSLPTPTTAAPPSSPTPWETSGNITINVGTTAPIPTPPVDGGGTYFVRPSLPVNGLRLTLRDADGAAVASLADALGGAPGDTRPLVGGASSGVPVSVEIDGAGLGVTFILLRP